MRDFIYDNYNSEYFDDNTTNDINIHINRCGDIYIGIGEKEIDINPYKIGDYISSATPEKTDKIKIKLIEAAEKAKEEKLYNEAVILLSNNCKILETKEDFTVLEITIDNDKIMSRDNILEKFMLENNITLLLYKIQHKYFIYSLKKYNYFDRKTINPGKNYISEYKNVALKSISLLKKKQQ